MRSHLLCLKTRCPFGQKDHHAINVSNESCIELNFIQKSREHVSLSPQGAKLGDSKD